MTDQTNEPENGRDDIDAPKDKGKNENGQNESEADINELLDDGDKSTTDQEKERDKKIAKSASDAVARLKIEEFIIDHGDNIFDKLEKFESYAQSAGLNGDMIFMAMSLPLINGIIHVASTREHLKDATEAVLAAWTTSGGEQPDPEKAPLLSALTLIYVAAEGWKKYKDDEERKARWERIRHRIEKLSEPLDVD